MHIGIVGGGIAGLTAAYRLASAGEQVTLWERAPKLGGQATSFPVAGGIWNTSTTTFSRATRISLR